MNYSNPDHWEDSDWFEFDIQMAVAEEFLEREREDAGNWQDRKLF
jgi:hypothetical protein